VNGETPFYKTAMGRDFFDRNVPLLVKELQKLNENLAKLIKQNEPKEEKNNADAPGDGGR
jgi:hypothetical protein